MTPSRDTRVSSCVVVASSAAAVIVAWWSLTSARVSATLPWPAAITPFGTQQIVVVHVLSALPLAWLLASAFVRTWPPSRRTFAMPLAWAIVGALLAMLTLYLGEQSVGQLTYQLEWEGKLAIRVLWSLILVLPWVLAARLLIEWPWQSRAPEPVSANLLLAVVVAVGLPHVHARNEARKQTQQAEAYIATGRFWEAWRLVVELAALSSRQPIHGETPHVQLGQLTAKLRKIAESVEKPLPSDANGIARIERASQWIALGRMDQAKQVLAPIAGRNPSAAMLLAAVTDDLRQWDSSIDACKQALSLLKRRGDEGANSKNLREQAYDRWAEVLRKTGRYQSAEKVLLDALNESSGSQAHFHFQLAQHYDMGGRPRDALRQYELAAQTDDNYMAVSAAAIKELTLNTPICFLRPAGMATR